MEWYLRFPLFIFVASVIMTPVLSLNYWKDGESDLSYHAIVKRPVDLTDGYKKWGYCAGVILNTRYVLTLFKCTRSGNILVLDKDIRIEIKQPKGRLDEGRYGERREDYIVEEVWYLHSLALLRSKVPFELSPGKCGISLPKKGQLNLWKVSFYMPNNAEIMSHKWCLDANYWHKVNTSKGIRKCTDDEIYDTPKYLVQSCLQHRTDRKCILPEGTPLIYNDILLGIKNYKGATPPPPHNNIKYDLFVNIIEEVPYIEKHMSDYEQCAPTTRPLSKNEF